jgi:glycosyltransferase involved in cell wall biosynthesis
MKRDTASIGVLEPLEHMTGGKAYRQAVSSALARNYPVEIFNVYGEKTLIPSTRISRLLAMARIKKPKDIWIRDFYPIIGMSFQPGSGKNIGLFLHLYTEGSGADALGWIFEKIYYRNLRRCDRVVAISNFWRDFLSGHGIQDVRVIRSGFELSEFEFSAEDLQTFREKYGFLQSPIIYIGNCREGKGAAEVYESLKDREYELVTSGEPEVEVPCRNLNLSYREYLLLLKVSSVVITMSQFREGWCRTAHEAMLCKTPVIGSGRGGMAELLEGGKQIICRNIAELPQYVKTAIQRRERFGEDGYRYGSIFTLERFSNEWNALVEELVEQANDSH